MKIAIISDIHGNLPALQAVLSDIDQLGVDLIINCGDTLAGPLEAARTADLLMARGIPMVAGNHERQMLTLPPDNMGPSDTCALAELSLHQRDWLATAPPTLQLTKDVFVCHGTPSSDLQGWLHTVTDDFGVDASPGIRPASTTEVLARLGESSIGHASLLLCGHTHLPSVVNVACTTTGRQVTIVNPGSVGLQAYDEAWPHRHHVENGSPHARYAIAIPAASSWQIELRQVMYDFESMARLATSRQRPDWAVALRTGRMVA